MSLNVVTAAIAARHVQPTHKPRGPLARLRQLARWMNSGLTPGAPSVDEISDQAIKCINALIPAARLDFALIRVDGVFLLKIPDIYSATGESQVHILEPENILMP